jgi:hypothetical protein
LNASSESNLDEAFTKLGQLRADALMVHIDALFQARNKQIVALAERYAVPTMYVGHQFVQLGGLISYGTNVDDMDRQAGIYIGKIAPRYGAFFGAASPEPCSTRASALISILATPVINLSARQLWQIPK